MIENSLSVEGPKCDFHTSKIYGGASRGFFLEGREGAPLKKTLYIRFHAAKIGRSVVLLFKRAI